MTWPKAIDPGRLRRKVEIQVQTKDVDTLGQPRDVWTTILTTQAEIRGPSGGEKYQAQQLTALVTHIVTIRWNRKTLEPGMRVLYLDQAGASPPTIHRYRVQWIDNESHYNVYLMLHCEEINGVES